MLGSNPSADPGPKTEAGAYVYCTRFPFLGILRFGTNALNPGGLGAGPQIKWIPIRIFSVSRFRSASSIRIATCYSVISRICVSKSEVPVNRFSLRPDQTPSRAFRRKGWAITTPLFVRLTENRLPLSQSEESEKNANGPRSLNFSTLHLQLSFASHVP